MVTGTAYLAHERSTRLRGPVKVIVSWKEADLSALELELDLGEAEICCGRRGARTRASCSNV